MDETFEDVADTEEGKALEHAYTVAQTASKTLTEARQAVAKVRAARGYFDAKGMKGTGQPFQGGSKGFAKSRSEKGKFKSKSPGGKSKGLRTTYGPCFICCGSPTHGYAQCPDRWSKGGKKGHGKKGKFAKPSSSSASGKGSYYGYSSPYMNELPYSDYLVDLPDNSDLTSIYVLSLSNDKEAYDIGTAKVIIDTGATESVSGVASMARLLDSSGMDTSYRVCLADRPKFRFGNGQCQQATSRIDLDTVSMGTMSFYLLDGEAENTPPLVGGRDLQARRTALSYDNLCLVHECQMVPGRWMVNSIVVLNGKHILMDLNEKPRRLRAAPENWLSGLADERRVARGRDGLKPVLRNSCMKATESLQHLVPNAGKTAEECQGHDQEPVMDGVGETNFNDTGLSGSERVANMSVGESVQVLQIRGRQGQSACSCGCVLMMTIDERDELLEDIHRRSREAAQGLAQVRLTLRANGHRCGDQLEDSRTCRRSSATGHAKATTRPAAFGPTSMPPGRHVADVDCASATTPRVATRARTGLWARCRSMWKWRNESSARSTTRRI